MRFFTKNKCPLLVWDDRMCAVRHLYNVALLHEYFGLSIVSESFHTRQGVTISLSLVVSFE